MSAPYRLLIWCCKTESRHHSLFLPVSSSIATLPYVRRKTFTTMVAKRKHPDVAPQDSPMEELLNPQLPSNVPRRSVRNARKPSQELRPSTTATEEGKLGLMSTRSMIKSQKTNEDVGVDEAMVALLKMENNLREAVKRQKLAVNQSTVPLSPENGEDEAAFLPQASRSIPNARLAEQEKRDLEKKKPRSTAQKGPKARKKDPKKDPDNRSDQADDISAPEDPEARNEDGDFVPEENDINGIKQEGARPPPVNSDYLPLPWKGRLGYACLNTYLRSATPSVFSSRTCRIASILDHRHPLQDPMQPEHPTKNRPDKDQPADVARGQRYVESLGLANARDIVKMIRWNDKYGIKFMRLSSEMFPFASHEEYGYKLAPFASEVLAQAGKVAGELGHRLTTHPGQFTQLGSPRREVIRNAIRDLEYHDEMLTLLRLPEQGNKDAIMILHMGGVYGDKAASLDRFRENYAKLSPSIKARLVLENDDVSWSVHDLLPICEELNIPLVLDYHHHNIIFNKDELREGTKDIIELYPRIKATWDRKGITQKMHYSESCSEAVTPRQRRKHRPRVMTLPPCADTMDLMIEAKDKEQAVFDLMRNFRLPGWDTFHDVIPYEREDENRPPPKPPKKKQRRKKRKAGDEEAGVEEVEEEMPPPPPPPEIPEAELGMGGPNNRVYWPLGMEEWLRPKKREIKKKKTGAEDDVGNDE
ncbi:UV-damage endonuclease [Whalleya microplaca]|nr:UV-damage endonuclease [Whalleya microplaca]